MNQLGRWAKGVFGAKAPSAAEPAATPAASTSSTPPTPPPTPPTPTPTATDAVAERTPPAPTAPTATADPGEQPVDKAARKQGPPFVNVAIVLAAIGLSLWLMTTYNGLLAPIFFTLNLMITVYPVYRWLVGRKVPSVVASMVSGLLVIAILLAFLFGLYWSVAAMVTKLPEYQEQFNTMYAQTITFLEGLGLSEEMLKDQIMSIDPKSIAGFATGLLSDVGSVGSTIVVMVTALIFMVMDTSQVQDRLALAGRSHGRFIDALGNFSAGIRKYWVITTVFGLIVAVLDGAVLLGLGVPLALVWAIFSFLTNYIPNIGFVIGLVPPALLALFDSGPKTALAVVIAYSVLNFVVQSIIQPKFAGNAVGLTPTLSFISLLLWTAVLGPLGALLALPMSLLVKALLIDPHPGSRWVNALISSRPEDAIDPEPVDEPTYTRARD
ncbi:AI-2E family transporter [Propionibacteriaceae bacterium G1746]|uniref:AI-2E family transporter n=1 Tax=Aestuariimicrobium sp. G57 TaxID=3418485 RepID=UPI003C1DE59D